MNDEASRLLRELAQQTDARALAACTESLLSLSHSKPFASAVAERDCSYCSSSAAAAWTSSRGRRSRHSELCRRHRSASDASSFILFKPFYAHRLHLCALRRGCGALCSMQERGELTD